MQIADIYSRRLLLVYSVELQWSNTEALRLAALSDFNGQLQARDIIRFLEKATDHVGKAIYEDRYLMPTEIRKVVSECSNDKIGEIRDEIKALGPIFDKLEHALKFKYEKGARSKVLSLLLK